MKHIITSGLATLFVLLAAYAVVGAERSLFYVALFGGSAVAFAGGALAADAVRTRCLLWLNNAPERRSEILRRAVQIQAEERSANEWAEYIPG